MTTIARRWWKMLSSGHDKAEESIRVSKELRKKAEKIVNLHYAQLDGEDQYWVDRSEKAMPNCECEK